MNTLCKQLKGITFPLAAIDGFTPPPIKANFAMTRAFSAQGVNSFLQAAKLMIAYEEANLNNTSLYLDEQMPAVQLLFRRRSIIR